MSCSSVAYTKWPVEYLDGRYTVCPNYGVTRDGERFLMVMSQGSAEEIHVVLNWTEELTRLVPVN